MDVPPQENIWAKPGLLFLVKGRWADNGLSEELTDQTTGEVLFGPAS